MIKHFCDKCGQEVTKAVTDKIFMRSHRVEYTVELCFKCFGETVGIFPEFKELIAKEDEKREAQKVRRVANDA